MSRTAILLLFMCTILAGCGIKPWVPAYERGLLAEPIMQFNRDPLSARYRQHVNATREGSRGAAGSVGGGCGCN